MGDKERILDRIRKGWTKDEIDGEIVALNLDRGAKLSTSLNDDDVRNLKNYIEYRNPSETKYNSIIYPQPQQTQQPQTDDKTVAKALANISGIIANTASQDDNFFESLGQDALMGLLNTSSKIANWIQDDNTASLRTETNTNAYFNRDLKNVSDASLGLYSLISNYKALSQAPKRLFGGEIDKGIAEEWYRLREEQKKREDQRVDGGERLLEKHYIEKELERLEKEGGIANFLKSSQIQTKEFVKSLLNGELGTDTLVETLLDPVNWITLGRSMGVGGGIVKQVAKGVIEGTVTNVALGTAVDTGASYGRGESLEQVKSTMFNSAAGNAGAGAFLGAVGGLASSLTPSPKAKATTQSAQQVTSTPAKGATQQQAVGVEQQVKELVDGYINDLKKLDPLKSEEQMVSDVSKAFELENAKEQIAKEAKQEAGEQIQEVVKLVDESNRINEASMIASQKKQTPNIEPSESLKRFTLLINGGNTVSDARLNGTGIINIITAEIKALEEGKGRKVEEIAGLLKSKGVSDELIQASIQSYTTRDITPLEDLISKKLILAIEDKTYQTAMDKINAIEIKEKEGEKILRRSAFSDDLADIKNVPSVIKVISASKLNPNFKALDGTQYRINDNSGQIGKISQSFDPSLHFEKGGFDGIPIIDMQGNIIAGNHRSEGIKQFTPQSRATYNSAAKEIYGEKVFDGLDYDDPVIVREILSDDKDLIARMSAYSNEGRLTGQGERIIASYGKYADKLKKLDNVETPKILNSEAELMGLLDAKDPDDASRAMLYYLSNDLPLALEEFVAKNPDEIRFSDIFVKNAWRLWNIKQLNKRKIGATGFRMDANIAPYLARAVRKMIASKEGNKRGMQKTLEYWKEIFAQELDVKGIEQRFQELEDTDGFLGDVLGILLNNIRGQKDEGVIEFGTRLDNVFDDVNSREAGLFGDPEPVTKYEAVLEIMKNKRGGNSLMSDYEISLYNDIQQIIKAKEEANGISDANLQGVGNDTNGLQAVSNEIPKRQDVGGDNQDLAIDGVGGDRLGMGESGAIQQTILEPSNTASDSGYSTNHIVSGSDIEVLGREQRISQDGLSQNAIGSENKGLDGDNSTGIQPSDGYENETSSVSNIERSIDLTTSPQGDYGASVSIETRADTSTPKIIEATDRARIADAEARRELQRKAESIATIKRGDYDNIAQTLPMLLPEQMGDVEFVENRFLTHRGALLTNATGTGKTFAGAGVIKRFVKQGKDNILIVVPNQRLALEWIKGCKEFLIDVNKVETTKDDSKGVSVLTYSNFYQNEKIRKNTYDLVVYDESHLLMENKNGKSTERLLAHNEITHKNFYKDIERGLSPRELEVEMNKREEIENESKVLFLSSTPFSSVKSLEYGNGLLYDRQSIDTLLKNNFGYRTRYGKLTIPESGVDTGLLERTFANSLMKNGVMRGRKLNNGYDYARQFLKVDGGLSSKIDEAMNILHSDYSKNSELISFYRERLNRIYISKINESVKAKEAIPFIKSALDDNKKIVIFHEFIDGGSNQHPFIIEDSILKESERNQRIDGKMGLAGLYNEFRSKHPQYFEDYNFPNPISLYKEVFGDKIEFFNGRDKGKDGKAIDRFNSDDSNTKILMVQTMAGNAGISLHDTTGKYPRIIIKLNLPTRPISEIQSEGRTYRVGQKSDTSFIYPITGTDSERKLFGSGINQSIGSVENLAMGDGARNLRDSFKEAYIDGLSKNMDYKNIEFKGGRDIDIQRETRDAFEEAKTYYYKRQKGKDTSGSDFFATPEPIGYKMAEWADLKAGEKVLEPSAGDGAIARFFSDEALVTAIEPSPKLSANLKIFTKNVINEKFEDYHIKNKYDAIVMNPPFGRNAKTAIEHTQKAFSHLRDNGRVVALLPNSPFVDKFMDTLADSGMSLVARVRLPQEAFKKVGANVNTSIFILDKKKQMDMPMNIDLSQVKNIESLFDEIKNVSMPKKEITLKEALREDVLISDESNGKHFVKYNNFIDKERWSEINSNIKTWGGYYDGKRKGWVMDTEALENMKSKFLC